jgi:cellulose synthase/poly-beta-1,6-N-acetylglucosamine synthase-like glycosyltransferase
MARIPQEFARSPGALRQANADQPFDRAALRSDKPVERGASSLPAELEFLARQGASPEELLEAIGAAPKGVRPVDSLLGEGIVREEDYYRALARHLGCEFYSGQSPFSTDFDAARGLRCGVAPLEWRSQGARAVIAPRAQSVRPLIEMAQSGRIRSGSFAVTSPQRFAALVRQHRGEAVLDDALGRLPRDLSARSGLSARQTGAAAALAAIGFAIAVGNFSVLHTIASAALWLVFSAAIVARSMASVANDEKIRPALLSDDELPVYTVVAALYGEADVVEDLITAFDAFDYPKCKLDIKLVVERRDLETLSRIAELRLPARYEVIVAPPGDPSTKPRALNIALACARGELLAVYDAEDAPSPDQLRFAASRFAAKKNLDCLQARLRIRNCDDSWLSTLFSLEYAALFDLINPGLCALGLPVALGGTSNHFRVATLESVGGWDEWNVAEDADLGVRLARFGYRVESLDSDTSEEAPHEFANWFRQRVRWQKGWMQTCIVHSRQPARFVRDLGSGRAAAAATLIGGAVVSALFWPAFAIDVVWRLLSVRVGDLTPWREASDVFTYILALAGVWAIVLPTIVAAEQRRLRVAPRTLALMPIYYFLVSAAAWAAIFDLVVRPHHWAKTAHGRTQGRTADRVALRPSPT